MNCLEWEAFCPRKFPKERARGSAARQGCGSTLAGRWHCVGSEGLSMEGVSVEGLPHSRPGDGASLALALYGQGLPSLMELLLYCPNPAYTASL